MSRRTMFFMGILFQLLAIFGLFVPHAWLVYTGTVVSLKTVPVDPYSLFRGAYVTLEYEVGNNLPVKWNGIDPLYVVLEEGDDGFYVRTAISEEKPDLQDGQVCLRGEGWYNQIHFPDIAQYFTQEEEGKFLEQERNARRLYVNVAVNDDCNALIRGIVLGPEIPADNLDFFSTPVPIQR